MHTNKLNVTKYVGVEKIGSTNRLDLYTHKPLNDKHYTFKFVNKSVKTGTKTPMKRGAYSR